MVVETVWQPFDENDFNFCDADNEYNDDFEGDDDCCNGKKGSYKKRFYLGKMTQTCGPSHPPMQFHRFGLGTWDLGLLVWKKTCPK